MNAPVAIGLVNRVDVLQQLLAAVSAVPDGVKLSIPQLRDALVSQADVLAGLQTLVLAGELDPTTLRPVRVPALIQADPDSQEKSEFTRSREGAKGFGKGHNAGDVPGAPLFAAAAAEAKRRNIGLAVVSREIFASKSAIYRLKDHSIRSETAAKVRAWLTSSEKLESPPAAAVAPPKPAVTKIPIGRHARSYCQQPKACVAGPKGPCRICHANKVAPALARSSTPTAPRRDPTQKPETPLMDVAERQRLNGQRHHARVRRAQEREATALLDQGVDPSKVKSNFQANTMRQVQDRRDREARDADPVEQAKLALQRKGLVVYSASVSGGRKDRFIVSGQQNQLSPAELLDLAERKTGQSFRRVA